jgi:hypothetical protein
MTKYYSDLSIINSNEIDEEDADEYGVSDTVGWSYQLDIASILQQQSKYRELIDKLNRDEFALKNEFAWARKYFNSLKTKHTASGDDLFDLF